MRTSVSILVLLVALCHVCLGASIEIPDIDELPALPRLRRQLSLTGEGGTNKGFIQGSGTRNFYQDDKIKLDGTLGAGARWEKHNPTQYGGFGRLDADSTVWSNGRTSLHGTGFAQRDIGTGMKPKDSFGAGAEIRHTITSGKHGQLDAFGGYQRQWNTPNMNQFNAGLGWRF